MRLLGYNDRLSRCRACDRRFVCALSTPPLPYALQRKRGRRRGAWIGPGIWCLVRSRLVVSLSLSFFLSFFLSLFLFLSLSPYVSDNPVVECRYYVAIVSLLCRYYVAIKLCHVTCQSINYFGSYFCQRESRIK